MNPQSVMQRTWLVLSMVGFDLLASACGGGHSQPHPPASALSASGTVVLPPGVSLKPATLTVTSGSGDAPVGSDSRFTVFEPPGGGAATVLLTEPGGKLVLLGHVQPVPTNPP